MTDLLGGIARVGPGEWYPGVGFALLIPILTLAWEVLPVFGGV